MSDKSLNPAISDEASELDGQEEQMKPEDASDLGNQKSDEVHQGDTPISEQVKSDYVEPSPDQTDTEKVLTDKQKDEISSELPTEGHEEMEEFSDGNTDLSEIPPLVDCSGRSDIENPEGGSASNPLQNEEHTDEHQDKIGSELMIEGHEEDHDFEFENNNDGMKNSLINENSSTFEASSPAAAEQGINGAQDLSEKISRKRHPSQMGTPSSEHRGNSSSTSASESPKCDLDLVKPQVKIRISPCERIVQCPLEDDSDAQSDSGITAADPVPSCSVQNNPAEPANGVDDPLETNRAESPVNVRQYRDCSDGSEIQELELLSPVAPRARTAERSIPGFNAFSLGNFQSTAIGYSNYFTSGESMGDRSFIKLLIMLAVFIGIIILILYFLIRKVLSDQIKRAKN